MWGFMERNIELTVVKNSRHEMTTMASGVVTS